MRRKNLISIDEFDAAEITKTFGVTSGFIKEIQDGPNKGRYMFKPIPDFIQDSYEQESIERGNALVEYTFGDVFKIILGQQAPEIGLIRDKENNLFLTSKFLDNFSHIDRFISPHSAANSSLPVVTGIEKVVITSLLCGDFDLNPGNIGVIPNSSSEGYIIAKIDHGAAGSIPENDDFASSIQDHYIARDYAKHLQFDLSETRKAIKEILAAPLESTINIAIEQLEAEKVNPQFIDVITYETEHLSTFERYLETRKERLKEFNKNLALIESIEHPDPEWKKSGAWIEAVQDPIGFATKNNYNRTVSQIIDLKTANAQQLATIVVHNGWNAKQAAMKYDYDGTTVGVIPGKNGDLFLQIEGRKTKDEVEFEKGAFAIHVSSEELKLAHDTLYASTLRSSPSIHISSQHNVHVNRLPPELETKVEQISRAVEPYRRHSSPAVLSITPSQRIPTPKSKDRSNSR